MENERFVVLVKLPYEWVSWVIKCSQQTPYATHSIHFPTRQSMASAHPVMPSALPVIFDIRICRTHFLVDGEITLLCFRMAEIRLKRLKELKRILLTLKIHVKALLSCLHFPRQ